jgi:hypothetical protein
MQRFVRSVTVSYENAIALGLKMSTGLGATSSTLVLALGAKSRVKLSNKAQFSNLRRNQPVK